MIHRHPLACVLAWMLWLLPAVAWGDAQVVLAVLASDEETASAMQRRAGQELALRGFTVVAHTPDPASDPLEATLARARSAGAVVGVVVALDENGGAQIDVIDRVTGKRLRRSLPAEDAGHGRSTIALAVAELVDASLIELKLAPRTARGEVAPPPDLPVPELPRERVGGQAGVTVGLLWPVQHPTPVGIVVADLGVRPSARLAILAEATLPLHAMRTELDLAVVRTLPFFVGVRTDVDLLPRRSPVQLAVQGAVNAIALRVDVDAEPGVVARSQTVWTTAGIVGLTLHGAVSRDVRLGVSLRMVAPFDDIRINFDGETVQRLGPVWLGGGASLQVRW